MYCIVMAVSLDTLGASFVFDLFDAQNVHDFYRFVALDLVPDIDPVSPGLYDLCFFQNLEMLRNRRLGFPDTRYDGAGTLLAIQQTSQNFDTSIISHCLQKLYITVHAYIFLYCHIEICFDHNSKASKIVET